VRVTAKVINIKDLDPAIEVYNEDMRLKVIKWLKVCGLLVMNTAKQRILKGPKTGRIYKKSNPVRLHQASAPGESPASDTGTLVSRIVMEVDEQKLEATVGTTVWYAKFLELGTRLMEARPFLTPALDEKKDQLVGLLRKIVKND